MGSAEDLKVGTSWRSRAAAAVLLIFSTTPSIPLGENTNVAIVQEEDEQITRWRITNALYSGMESRQALNAMDGMLRGAQWERWRVRHDYNQIQIERLFGERIYNFASIRDAWFEYQDKRQAFIDLDETLRTQIETVMSDGLVNGTESAEVNDLIQQYQTLNHMRRTAFENFMAQCSNAHNPE